MVFGAVLGLIVGNLVGFGVAHLLNQRNQKILQAQKDLYKKNLSDLRTEQMQDKEQQRRWRYQLSKQIQGTNQEITKNSEPSSTGELSSDELQYVFRQVEELSTQLEKTKKELRERNTSLRVARLSIQQIRHQIENRGRPDPEEAPDETLESAILNLDETDETNLAGPIGSQSN